MTAVKESQVEIIDPVKEQISTGLRPKSKEEAEGRRWFVRLSPFRLIVGIVLGDWGNSVAQYNVGIIKGLLHLHGTVGAPSNIICFESKGKMHLRKLQ